MSIKRVIIAGTAVAFMAASLPSISADAEQTGAAVVSHCPAWCRNG